MKYSTNIPGGPDRLLVRFALGAPTYDCIEAWFAAQSSRPVDSPSTLLQLANERVRLAATSLIRADHLLGVLRHVMPSPFNAVQPRDLGLRHTLDVPLVRSRVEAVITAKGFALNAIGFYFEHGCTSPVSPEAICLASSLIQACELSHVEPSLALSHVAKSAVSSWAAVATMVPAVGSDALN